MIKRQILLGILLVLLVIGSIIPVNTLFRTIINKLWPSSPIQISIRSVNDGIDTLACDSMNTFLIKVHGMDYNSKPLANIELTAQITKGYGELYPKNFFTNQNGDAILQYTPNNLSPDQIHSLGNMVSILVSSKESKSTQTFSFKLVPVPVVMVHGYLETAALLKNMVDFLGSMNYAVSVFDYDSKKGVLEGVDKLKTHLQTMHKTYAQNGIQVNRFDLVCHSLGGLVSRYYTTDPDYYQHTNVRKIIFVSVPHKGSPWAPIAIKYMNDQGISDLIPSGPLLTQTFPTLINGGLNPTIQVSNILAQFDEVVDIQSASLEEWDIRTELFNVGVQSQGINEIVNQNLVEAPNHRGILYNRTVFEDIAKKLGTELKYPKTR